MKYRHVAKLEAVSVGRRGFIIVGGSIVIGAGTYAWLRKLGYEVDPAIEQEAREKRAKSGALPHEPFDPAAMLVLSALIDHLLPGDATKNLPSASAAGVLDYLVAAATAPGMRQLRDEVLKLTRHLNLIAKKTYQGTFDAIDAASRESLIAAVASGADARATFDPARALEATLRLSLEGYLGHPDHGGNRDASVWSALSIAMPRERSPHHHGG